MHESGRSLEPTPCAYCGECVTGQAPCYAEMRMVSPVHISSPVRSIPAPLIGRARMGIQPGRKVPVQRSWSPVYLLGPGYPALPLRTVSPVSLHSPVRPVHLQDGLCQLYTPDLQCASTAQYHQCRHHAPGLQCASRVQYVLLLLPALALRCVSPCRYHQCWHHAPIRPTTMGLSANLMMKIESCKAMQSWVHMEYSRGLRTLFE